MSFDILASCEKGKHEVNSNISVSGDCKSLTIVNFAMENVGTYRCYSRNANRSTHYIAIQIKCKYFSL